MGFPSVSNSMNSGSTGGSSSLKGTGYKAVSTLSPEQRDLFMRMFSGSKNGISGGLDQLSQLAQGGNEQLWNKLEAPALRQHGQLQGQIASRFSGMGMGGRRGSGFQNASSAAGTDLSERLQSNRMNLQQQAIQQLLSLGNSLLGRETEAFIPKQKPFWQEFATGVSGGIGEGIGSLPMLAAL